MSEIKVIVTTIVNRRYLLWLFFELTNQLQARSCVNLNSQSVLTIFGFCRR